MGYGGYHCYPRRFGGNRHSGKPLTEVIHESLNAQRGDAYNTDDTTTIVWLENQAYARCIAYDGWETNERLALQWDPNRTTDMLPRWESIFKLAPAPTDSDRARRQALLARWQRFAGPANHARMVTALQSALGDFFVAIEYIALPLAVVHTPDATYPASWNATVAAGVPWYSTIAHFLVRLTKPSYASEREFYEAAGKVFETLDPICSAFVTFDWYRGGPTCINVAGGPSCAGFFLDDEHNLDNEVFDV